MISVVKKLKKHFGESLIKHDYISKNNKPYILIDNIKVTELEYQKNPTYYNKRIKELYQRNTNYDIFYETLIEKFLDIIPFTKNTDNIITKIINFCENNNLKIQLIQKNVSEVEGEIINDTIFIYYPSNTTDKELIYTILHELSHFITNKSSNNKIKEFLNKPNHGGVNINNPNSLKQELDYILMPGEAANWAFTLSLRIFDEIKINPSDLYKTVKRDFQKTENFIESPYYQSLPNSIKPYYNIIAYVLQLKKFNKRLSQKYMTRLNKFVNLTSKYYKRLVQHFGLKSI